MGQIRYMAIERGSNKSVRPKKCKNVSCGAEFVPKSGLQRACCGKCEGEIRLQKKSRTLRLGAESAVAHIWAAAGMVPPSIGVRKKTLRVVSERQEAELAALAVVKLEMVARLEERCQSCGAYGPVDLSHLIKRQDKRFVLDPRNLVLQGSEHTGTCRCHDEWEVGNFEKVRLFRNFDELMARVREMDEGKYWRMVHRFEKQKANHERIT